MLRKRRLLVPVRVAALIAISSAIPLAGHAQDRLITEEDRRDRLAPFVPSPEGVVDAMLQLAHVGKHDCLYDLGSGDGRIVIQAAKKYEAEAVGVEIEDDLFRKSTARIEALGLQGRARILHMNMYKVDLRPATVVTLYLLTSVNERLKPILERDLRPGARVVTHDFRIPGWEPARTLDVMTDAGISKKIYLYVRP